jgi:hypothetical protein
MEHTSFKQPDGLQFSKTRKQTDGLVDGTNVLDSIMDREARHKRLMALASQHKELDKAKPQAIEYPHVYGAPKGGNILDAYGRKYALPLGTERHLEDVFLIYKRNLNENSITKRSLFRQRGNLLNIKNRPSL